MGQEQEGQAQEGQDQAGQAQAGQSALLSQRERASHKRQIAFTIALFVGAFIWESTPAAGIPLCPFRFITGFSCFGCGMTRACIHAVHGDVLQSFHYHPFAIPLLSLFALNALHKAAQLYKGEHLPHPRPAWLKRGQSIGLLLGLVALLIFGLLRFSLEIAGILPPV